MFPFFEASLPLVIAIATLALVTFPPGLTALVCVLAFAELMNERAHAQAILEVGFALSA